ncbi:MAG: hypothetical protein C0410_00725 [Anaerolinea sp.]|nr:hypothetical protein [Anaerolinea sp.]
MTLPKTELQNQASPTGSTNPSVPGSINNREYVRIYYPVDCPKKHVPELTIHYRTYQILDISEAGLHFLVPRMNLLPDDIMKGTIKFTDESVVEFSGVVVRRTKNEIALKLIIGIPYSYIASEQVRLRNLVAAGEIPFVRK